MHLHEFYYLNVRISVSLRTVYKFPHLAVVYELFLNWASYAKVDGIVVGATYPKIIAECKKKSPRTAIYSPGVGAQGGDPHAARKAGTKYLIVGRSIINSSDPAKVAKTILARRG